MKNKMIITVVVYNKMISEINSLNIFYHAINDLNVELLVFDNSSDKRVLESNEYYSRSKEFKYFCNKENLGLSKCYNKAIEYASKYDDYWMMFADDDTFFSEEYVNRVYLAVQSEESDIICGIIKTGEGFFSPVEKRTFWGKNLKYIIKPGVYTDICAVNSGLTVRKRILSLTGSFDERLFLDLVDYNFMNVLSSKGLNKILVVPGEVLQNFSGNTKTSYQSQKNRIEIFARDVNSFCKINNISSIYGNLQVLKRKASIIINSLPNSFSDTQKAKVKDVVH